MVAYYGSRMSGSEDEYETQIHSGMSKAELRRSNKPIMEKRRRARINQSLDELKTLILEAMKKDPTRHSKLEKADILEMTLKHLQSVRRQQINNAGVTDPQVITKFRSGFSECASEVSRFVSQLENVDPGVKQRLLNHLNNCVNNLNNTPPLYNGQFVPSYTPFSEVKVSFQSDFQSGDENNNGSARIQIPSGVQLIPSRLPTGELALLVPPTAGISGQGFPMYPLGVDSSRIIQPSAFTAVQRPHSPLLSPSTSSHSFDDVHHSEQYPNSQSPPQLYRSFEIPEQRLASTTTKSVASETQKPQISSTSDQTKPTSSKRDLDMSEHILRHPLSVITDRTHNRPMTILEKESMKRSWSDEVKSSAPKRTRYHEPANSSPSTSSIGVMRIKEETAHSTDEVPKKMMSFDRANLNTKIIHSESSSTTSNDMWRPW